MTITAYTDTPGLKLLLRGPTGLVDQSGNSVAITNASGVQATRLTKRFGGITHFTFEGFQYFSLPNAFFSGWTSGEIIAAIRSDNDPAPNTNLTGLWSLGATGAGSTYPFTDGIIYESFGTSSRKTTVNPTADLNRKDIYNIYNVRSASADWENLLNGTSLSSTGTNTVSFPASGVEVGRSVGPSYLAGQIAVLAIYNPMLTSLQRADVVAFMQTDVAFTSAFVDGKMPIIGPAITRTPLGGTSGLGLGVTPANFPTYGPRWPGRTR